MVTLLLLDAFGFELEIHKNQPSNFELMKARSIDLSK
jgi:hypothetical protein